MLSVDLDVNLFASVFVMKLLLHKAIDVVLRILSDVFKVLDYYIFLHEVIHAMHHRIMLHKVIKLVHLIFKLSHRILTRQYRSLRKTKHRQTNN